MEKKVAPNILKLTSRMHPTQQVIKMPNIKFKYNKQNRKILELCNTKFGCNKQKQGNLELVICYLSCFTRELSSFNYLNETVKKAS
jgi:hypothetical protein